MLLREVKSSWIKPGVYLLTTRHHNIWINNAAQDFWNAPDDYDLDVPMIVRVIDLRPETTPVELINRVRDQVKQNYIDNGIKPEHARSAVDQWIQHTLHFAEPYGITKLLITPDQLYNYKARKLFVHAGETTLKDLAEYVGSAFEPE